MATKPHVAPRNSADLLHQAKRLMNSPAYQTPGHVDRQKVFDTVNKIYRTVYGTGPAHDPEIAATNPGVDSH